MNRTADGGRPRPRRTGRVFLAIAAVTVTAVVGWESFLASAVTNEGGQQAQGVAGLLGRYDYDAVRPGPDVPIWQGEHEPKVDGDRKDNRISVVPAAEAPTGGVRPRGNVMRVTLRPYNGGDGDVTKTDGYKASRAEVFGRQASDPDAPVEAWPDPEGGTRWYSFGICLDPSWKFSDKQDKWMILTQWKGLASGRPPVALELRGDSWWLGGKKGADRLAQAVPGQWTHFVIGLHLSTDPEVGWAEVWVDGQNVLPRDNRATLRKNDGKTDPVYLKQGIYRSKDWDTTHVAYFSSLSVGTRRAAVS